MGDAVTISGAISFGLWIRASRRVATHCMVKPSGPLTKTPRAPGRVVAVMEAFRDVGARNAGRGALDMMNRPGWRAGEHGIGSGLGIGIPGG